jgi:hypothetical protein
MKEGIVAFNAVVDIYDRRLYLITISHILVLSQSDVLVNSWGPILFSAFS